MGRLTFCDLCGNILEIKNENGKVIGICSCGFRKEEGFEIGFSEKFIREDVGEGAINENPQTLGFPHECSKCGHMECDVWDLGVQIGDESNIILYKCKKCKYVERQADGSGIS